MLKLNPAIKNSPHGIISEGFCILCFNMQKIFRGTAHAGRPPGHPAKRRQTALQPLPAGGLERHKRHLLP